MRRAAIAAVVGVLAVGAAAPADPFGRLAVRIASPVNPAEVRGLVEQLGAPDYRTREKAGRQLLALGDRVLPQLTAAARATEDAEVARRLQVLVEQIDAARLTTARRVTLKLQNKSAKAVVEELARQSGYALQYGGGDDDRRYSFDLADVPFWEALDRVCNEIGLQANPNGNDGGLHVYQGNTYSPFTSYSGPFRFLATNVSMNRNVQLSGLPRSGAAASGNESLHLNLNVHAEPKAPLIAVGQPTLTRAVDETGASLVPPAVNTQTTHYRSYGGYYRSYYQSVNVSLYRPNPSAARIREIRGTVPVTVLSGTRPDVTVPDLLSAKKERYAGRTVDLDLKAADYANDVLSVEVTITRRNGDPNDYNWMHSIGPKIQVADAAGNAYVFNGVNRQSNSANVTTLTMQFRHPYNKKVGKPAKLEYVEWLTVTKDVEFAFKDIPLP